MLKLRIHEIATEQGFNRNQLQLKSSVTLPLLTRYWNNTTKSVRLDALEKIARALDVSPHDLIVFVSSVPNEYAKNGEKSASERPIND